MTEKKKRLTLEDLAKLPDVPQEEVYIPQWDRTILVQGISKATQIKLGRPINADDTDTLDDKNFFLLTQETSSSVFSLNENDIKEFIFKTNNDAITYTSNNVTYNKFKSFIIKIALLSTESCNPPKIKDLRAIALDE